VKNYFKCMLYFSFFFGYIEEAEGESAFLSLIIKLYVAEGRGSQFDHGRSGSEYF
jgi:hypothetical protein